MQPDTYDRERAASLFKMVDTMAFRDFRQCIFKDEGGPIGMSSIRIQKVWHAHPKTIIVEICARIHPPKREKTLDVEMYLPLQEQRFNFDADTIFQALCYFRDQGVDVTSGVHLICSAHDFCKLEHERSVVASGAPSDPKAAIRGASATKVPEGSERECGVCMEHVPNVGLGCGHMFCPECIASVDLCPTCRAPIRECKVFYV